jgi:hypothetical protein
VVFQIINHRFRHIQPPAELGIGTRSPLSTKECSKFPIQQADFHRSDAALSFVLSGGTIGLEKPVSIGISSLPCSKRIRYLQATLHCCTFSHASASSFRGATLILRPASSRYFVEINRPATNSNRRHRTFPRAIDKSPP